MGLVGMFFRGTDKQPWTGMVMSREDERGWHMVHVTSVRGHDVSFYRLMSLHELDNWTFYESLDELAADKARAEAAWAKEMPHSIEEFLLQMEANEIENVMIGEDLLKAWHKWCAGRQRAAQ